MNYKIGAVVVTYNRLNFLKECVDALLNQTAKLNTIIIINNGSTDGTNDWLANQKELLVINQENIGGAGGFARGVKEGALREFDYLWLMDDDVIPSFDALEKLLDITKLNIKFSYLASLVVGKNDNIINLPQVNKTIDERTGYGTWANKLNDGLVQISTATFVSILVDVNCIKKVGLPFKEFFIWGDDIEYTARLSKIQPAYLVGKSVVKHLRNLEKSPTIETETDIRRIKMHFYYIRNNFYLLREEYGMFKFLLNSVRYFYGFTRKNFFNSNFGLKLRIIFKGLTASVFFNPKIEKC